MFDIADYNLIDLTLPYQKGMAGYDYEIARELKKDGWNARHLKIYSHAGTHMDAPLHFGISGDSIDLFTPNQLMGKAWVINIDISQPQQLISLQDLGEVPNFFKTGDSLILKTGWSKHRNEAKYRSELPRISRELAKWCVNNKVKMLAVEPPSVADVNNLDEVTEIHEILLGGDVIIIEGLTNLNKITRKEVMLIALPLKIKGGDGAPARVIALEEK